MEVNFKNGAEMDENIVAVHMIETSDGTYVIERADVEDDGAIDGDIAVGGEIISANDEINDMEEDINEANIKEDNEEEYDDSKDMDQTDDDEPNEEMAQSNDDNAEADDIIIAEAVVVTQYSCKFCNRRFDTIDKVKNHYLLRHNKDQTLIERFSRPSTVATEPENSGDQNTNEDIVEEVNSGDVKPTVIKRRPKPESSPNVTSTATTAPKTRSNVNLRVVSNIREDANSRKKRGRKPTGVQRKYPCDWPGCNYVARHSVHLKDHKRTHTGEKPYRCNWPDCGLSFIQGSALKTHMRTHTGEKPYPCEWPGCTLFFSQKNNVKVHMRTHTGEKPYVCDWPGCEWRFAVKGNLDDHKRVHAGEKFFVCDWPGCTRSYTQNSHLRKHQLIHMEDKPFACDWPGCHYRSVRQCDVTNHKITHTGEKKFVCTVENCGKGFARSHHLKRHMSSTHPEVNEVDEEYNE